MDVHTPTGSTPEHELDSNQMRTLFREIDQRATDANAHVDITVIGSARMELMNPGERPTTTIDVLYDSAKLSSAAMRNEIVGQIAIESHGTLGGGWMNDCASWLARPEALAPDERNTTVYDGESLTVQAASPERMLMMKIEKIDDLTSTAGRTDDPTRRAELEKIIALDINDVAMLGDELGAHSIADITREYNRECGRAPDAELKPATTDRLQTVMPKQLDRIEMEPRTASPTPETDPVSELREIDIAAEAVWRQRTAAAAKSREGDYRFDDALRVNAIPEIGVPDPDDEIMFTEHDDAEIPTNAEIDEMIRQAGKAAGQHRAEKNSAAAPLDERAASQPTGAADIYEPHDRETAPQRPSARTARPAAAVERGRNNGVERTTTPSRL